MFSAFKTILLAVLAVPTLCQQRGTVSSEVHPSLTTYKCTKSGGCTAQSTKIVLDANWRWLHGPGPSYKNCYVNNLWDSTLCPDPTTCAQNCALDGADYFNTYGISASGPNLTLLMFPSGGLGSRVYLLSDDTHYQLFRLKNQEISFDVDVSGLPCGANGAMYLTSMAADGGQSTYANNRAGAYMGTGYCDAQCPRDIKFINGEANILNWSPSTRQGRYGSCCHEMDLWESNAVSTAYTAHPCSNLGPYRCNSGSANQCNVCDRSGCDFNPYRLGNPNFYGVSKTLATNPGKMRVITQFITSDGTSNGALSEIRRFYIRNGQIISNPSSKVSGVSGNSISDSFCTNEKRAFNESNDFSSKGGMNSMEAAINNGMVLTLSAWLDGSEHMLWLDSIYPAGATGPGAARGTCPTNSGDPDDVKARYPNAQVQFSNIKYGDIGSTYGPPYP